MPRALEPGDTFEVVLDYDKEKPAAERPTFIYRAMSCREFRTFKPNWDGSVDGPSLDALLKSAKDNLVGWRNMLDPESREPIPFDLAEFDKIVTPLEAWELVNLSAMGQEVSADDKKKSASPA